ncbi:MAG: YfhO family protein [Chloroflexi bacterium]|nr:YfhO family protein [Chloroflexota bacterium]
MLSFQPARLAPTWNLPWSVRARRLRHELAGSSVALVALLGLFGRFVVPGVVGHQRDTGAFYYPLTAWLAGELAAGRFPLWCPLIFAGYPLVADGEIGLLYPPNILLLLLLPVDVAFIALRSAHYLLAAAGLYALGRVLGLGRMGSAFGGVVFALGGFMYGHLDHGNIVRSAAWLPSMLACADLALRVEDRRRWLWLALGAGTLTLAGLGLHPQIVLIELVALGAWVGLRALALALADGDTRPRMLAVRLTRLAGRSLLVIAAIGGLGLAGAGVQLLPTYELGAASSRGDGLSYAQAAAGGLAPVDLFTLLLPYGFRADPAVQWMRYPYWESTVYVGVIGLFLALVGLVAGRRSVSLPVAGVGLLGLLLAMSSNAPVDLYGWLWTLPGFSSMRAPVRYSLVFELALAVLAALGVDRLRAQTAPRGARPLAVFVVGSSMALAVGGFRLRAWLLADESGTLRWLQETYLQLPRDRAALTASAVREGLLGTLLLDNPWTLLALASGAVIGALLLTWAWRGRGSARLAALAAALGAAELLTVAHGFHPTVSRAELRAASRPLRFLSEQPGLWRTFLTGRSDLSVTSRPALFGVAQAYGYSSLPTARMERYWTRVNEVDDDLLDLWNVRYVVEPKGSLPPMHAASVSFDPARPLLDGRADSPLGDEHFRLAPTPADAIRVLGSLTYGGSLADGEPVAEITVSGSGFSPLTLVLRAGEHLSEAAYDQHPGAVAHRKAQVGMRWEPRDPAGKAFPRDVYLADLPLPSTLQIEQIDVRAVARTGLLRLAGLGLHERGPNVVRSVLASHRAKYRVAYDADATLIYENLGAQPRAYLAPRAVSAPPNDWTIVRLTDDALNPRTTALLERPAEERVHVVLDGPPIAPAERAEIVRYEPDLVQIQVRAQETRYLVLADADFPGWAVTVNGVEARSERANYLFRAVEVPPGEHTVTWRYRPTSLLLGAGITAAALVMMVALTAAGLGRRRAPVPRPAAAAG